MGSSQPINVKLLLIGNSSVGKSSLLLRFSDEQWVPEDEASATIGVDFRVSVPVRDFCESALEHGSFISYHSPTFHPFCFMTMWRGASLTVNDCLGS